MALHPGNGWRAITGHDDSSGEQFIGCLTTTDRQHRRRRHRVLLVPQVRCFWGLVEIGIGIVPIFSRPQKTLCHNGGAVGAVSWPTAGCLLLRKVRKCLSHNGEARHANGWLPGGLAKLIRKLHFTEIGLNRALQSRTAC